MAKTPFKGVIKLDVRDSLPDTVYTEKSSRGSSERPVCSVRRHRLGRVVAVRHAGGPGFESLRAHHPSIIYGDAPQATSIPSAYFPAPTRLR